MINFIFYLLLSLNQQFPNKTLFPLYGQAKTFSNQLKFNLMRHDLYGIIRKTKKRRTKGKKRVAQNAKDYLVKKRGRKRYRPPKRHNRKGWVGYAKVKLFINKFRFSLQNKFTKNIISCLRYIMPKKKSSTLDSIITIIIHTGTPIILVKNFIITSAV